MSLGTANRDGGKTSESGHLRPLPKLVTGDVITGLAVSQRAAGANMSVDVAVGDAFLRRSDGSYAHPVYNDAVYNQAIATADGANPRRDILVIYLDYAAATSTAVSNNTNGVVKIMVVAGTPAGSPTDPTDPTIQAAVGAGNPYTKLARIRVPAGQTSISNTLIDDLRVMTNPVMTAAREVELKTGWASIPETLTFTSFNATTRIGIIAIPAGGLLKYNPGQWLKITQVTGGTKYGFINAFTDTSLTVNFFNLYTLNNEAISNPAYSVQQAPLGVPLLPVVYTDAAGWTVHDHGNYKEWLRTATDNPNYGSGTAQLRAALGVGVPTGHTNFDGFDVKLTWSVSGNAHNWRVHIESGISGVTFFNANVSTAAADWKDIRVWWRVRRLT